MPDPASPIVLATLNARYIHASLGLRYLLANLGDLAPSAALAEFELRQRPAAVALYGGAQRLRRELAYTQRQREIDCDEHGRLPRHPDTWFDPARGR